MIDDFYGVTTITNSAMSIEHSPNLEIHFAHLWYFGAERSARLHLVESGSLMLH